MSTTCDFNSPTLDSVYTDVLQDIEDRATVLATMDYAATTNIPNGAIGYNGTSNLLQEYSSSGASWSTLDLSGHLSGVLLAANNLSEVDPASSRTSLGLGALATQSTINNTLWSGDRLSIANGGTGSGTEAGARTALGLGDLAIKDTINNADWSGTVLSVTNGGTGASTASGARTALGLGALALLGTINNSNWSGTDLAVANGGTGASDASGARTTLGAAASGSNGDITALTNCPSITDNAAMTIRTTNSNTLTLGTNATQRFQITADGDAVPYTDNSYDSGDASHCWKSVYAVGIQGHSAADFTIKGQTGKGIKFVVNDSFEALKIRGDAGANFLEVNILGNDSSQVPGTNAPVDWWEIKSGANSRFIPLYTA